MKSKQKSSSSKQFAKGGSTKMFGQQSAEMQKPGQAAQAAGKKVKWPGGSLGGKTKMFGKQSACARTPGTTSGQDG